MSITVRKLVRFEAAHHIPNHKGVCKQPHGHSYVVEVFAKAQGVDKASGMVMDFLDMKDHIAKIIVERCDHQDLNKIYPGMLTTAENLATQWLKDLRALDRRYCRVRVHETHSGYAEASA